MSRPAIASGRFQSLNRRPSLALGASQHTRGRWVRNLAGVNSDVTDASWTNSITGGTGTGSITDNTSAKSTQIDILTSGTGRYYKSKTITGLDTTKYYALCVNFTAVSGSFTNTAILISTGVTEGESQYVISTPGRKCIRFKPTAANTGVRIGVGCSSNETAVAGEYIAFKELAIYEIASLSDVPHEFVDGLDSSSGVALGYGVIYPYASPCTVVSNAVTEAAAPAVEDWLNIGDADVIISFGDSLGNDSSEFPQQLRDYARVSIINKHIAGAALSGQILTAIQTYLANPTGFGPCNIFPRTAILEGGVNDLLAGADLATMQSRFTTCAGLLTAAGYHVIAPNITPFGLWAGWSAGIQTIANGYNAWLATRTDVYHVNVNSMMRDPANSNNMASHLNIGDGLHTSSAGSLLYGTAVGLAALAINRRCPNRYPRLTAGAS